MKDFKVNMNAVLVILLVISLWMNYSSYNQIDMLRNDVNSTYTMLQNDINSIRYSVSNSLDNFVKESKWIRESSFNVKKFTDDLQNAEVEATIHLNERNKNEKLYVVAIPRDGDENLKLDVQQSTDLTFKVQMTLPADYDYEIQLVGENEDFSRSDVLGKVYLRSYKSEIINIDGELLGGEYNSNSQKGHYDFYVAINQMRKSDEMFADYLEDLEIVEVKADVYYGEKYAKTIDFLKETNYTPMDIRDISNSIPEIAMDDMMIEFEKKYFFSGKFDIEGETEFPDIVLLVKVKDSKGNSYKQMFGDYMYQEEIERKLLQ